MAYVLKLVTAADVTLVDFHGTNSADLSGLVVSLRDTEFDLTNPPETERSLFEASSPGGSLAFRRHPIVESTFMVNISAASQAALLAGISRMGQYLQDAGYNKWLLKWQPDGGSEARYFEIIDADLPPLMTGEDGRGYFVYTRFEGRDIPIRVVRQPYARGALISSDVNLLRDGAYVNEVNTWTWDSSVNIVNFGGSREGYQFQISTTGARNRQQTTATGTFASGDVATFQFKALVEAGTGARARAVVRFLDSASVALGTEQIGGQVTLTTVYQTFSVTTSAAPATTSKALVSIRFENVDATTYTVSLQHAQIAKESSASLFREGTELVSNNPILTGTVGRMMPVYIHGSAPTPAAISIKGDTGSQIAKALISKRSTKGLPGGRNLFNFDSGYTFKPSDGTLYNSTTSVDDNANGGNGNVAQTATGGTFFNRRTRTLVTGNYQGTFDVYLRVRASAASLINLQMRWGLSDADPVAYAEDVVVFDTTGLATFPYVHFRMGRIVVPDNNTQASIEFWSELESGTASAMLDIVTLVSVDEAASIVDIPGASSEDWLGKYLITPTNPAGLTAGTLGGSDSIILDAVNEAAGTKPTTGLPWPVAYHTVIFETHFNTTVTATLRVRNITDSTDAVTVSKSQTTGYGAFKTVTLNFTSVAAKSYQPQVVVTSVSGGQVTVLSITHTAVPFVALNESISTDAELGTVKKLNTSSIPVIDLQIHGSVPMWLDPGLNVLYFHFDDIPVAGYTSGQAVKDRSPTVKVQYRPRYLHA